MFFRRKVTWSPVETDYLKANLDKVSKDQLCIALGKSRNALERKIQELNGTYIEKKETVYQSKIGQRKDLGIFVRSGWEANCMRLFNTGLAGYKSPEYEPETFSFTEHVPPKGAALSYTPDFRVKKGKKKYWIEIKGNWLRGSDKTKLRRFKKFYPEEFKKFIAIVSSKNTKTAKFFLEDLGLSDSQVLEYNELKKLYSKKIPNWET
jgi:biotin operon repressor